MTVLDPVAIRESLTERWVPSEAFRRWLVRRRWFPGRGVASPPVRVEDVWDVAAEDDAVAFGTVLVVAAKGREERYHVPLILRRKRWAGSFPVSLGEETLHLGEGEVDKVYAEAWLGGLSETATRPTWNGRRIAVRGTLSRPVTNLAGHGETRAGHVLVSFSAGATPCRWKSFRRLDAAVTEGRILRRLHDLEFAHVPPWMGDARLEGPEGQWPLAVVQEEPDGIGLLEHVVVVLAEDVRRGRKGLGARLDPTLEEAASALAALHGALTDVEDEAFRPEAITDADVRVVLAASRANLAVAARELRRLSRGRNRVRALAAQIALDVLTQAERPILAALNGLHRAVGLPRIATPGNLSLERVLRRPDGGLLFADFEADPGASDGKRSPLADVASFVCSLGRAKHVALERAVGRPAVDTSMAFVGHPLGVAVSDPALRGGVERLNAWESRAARGFVDHYLSCVPGSLPLGEVSPDVLVSLSHSWVLERTLDLLRWEVVERSNRLLVPVEGLVRRTLALPAGEGDVD